MRSLPAAALATAVAASAALAPADQAPVLADHPPSSTPAAQRAQALVRYDRDIRPLLSDRCFLCHGPDPSTRKVDLRLDLREEAVADRDGLFAIVPGSPEESELWRRISTHDAGDLMPPPRSGKRALSEAELALVRQWIEEGAVYEPHWSFVPPARPPLPAVNDGSWCRTPIDRFILEGLERAGVAPAPEADPETLLRRAFLDLTGLPPTPEEMDAFLADGAADPRGASGAYERWVDRLLEETPYRERCAERMASPWLDAARYADTAGIHMDAGRQIWLWRDWVLEAFRDNLPFDRFLTAQLAGDLLPDATDRDRIASGFNRNHVTSDEGGAIAEEYLVEYAVDRAATTGSVFLGLTVGCARCHDHKYDPISQEEFYSFYAFFNSVDEPGLYSQTPDAQRAHEPFMVVPTPEQVTERSQIRTAIAEVMKRLETPAPGEDAERAAFLAKLPAQAALAWQPLAPIEAASEGGAELELLDDGSVRASGTNPAQDAHVVTLRTPASDLRLLMIEALPDASFPHGRVGRAPNGNAVLTGVTVEAASMSDPAQRTPVRFVWAWADVEQTDGDFKVSNILEAGDARGWAMDAHRREGGRMALLLAEAPFGFEGGTELTVRLEYASQYENHVLGRVKLSAASLGDAGLAMLPATASGWYVVGPFSDVRTARKADGDAADAAPAATPADASGAAPPTELPSLFDAVFGPEEDEALALERNFGNGNQYWRPDPSLADERLNALAEGVNVTYVGRHVFAPTARTVEVSLGSDDGFRLFVNGKEAAARQVERGLAPDQDRATLALRPGINSVVLKVVNTGGASGFHWRTLSASPDPTSERAPELAGDLVLGLAPPEALSPARAQRLDLAWRSAFVPRFLEGRKELAALEERLHAIEAAAPRTMVMRELPKPRETFVLERGQYDRPDRNRPVQRGVPAALGALDDSSPRDRLGLAQWMTAPENPLVTRVAANRLWETLFGAGLVRTSEDFGLQGEWPTHPELLDWLAVELRESGWDLRRLVRLIVTSSAYRQSSRIRPELAEIDPDNRLLAFYPRRRLSAEQLRDQALYVSGLLVERFGGPSVKPYQPEGLWREVSMPGSNTRIYERGQGEELWRRSLYTYWKRAAPPPAMLAFDAPTRESCTIRRIATNTPLQALVLWNDEQFVEAARVLAERTLQGVPATAGPRGSSADEVDRRIAGLFRRCVGRFPDEAEADAMRAALEDFRARYREQPSDAEALASIGEAPRAAGLAPAEVAAWTMLASSVLNLHATCTQR